MKNLPLDVKLLKIGLNYANLRAAKEKISHLFVNQHQDQNVEYENLTFIHAKVVSS